MSLLNPYREGSGAGLPAGGDQVHHQRQGGARLQLHTDTRPLRETLQAERVRLVLGAAKVMSIILC